MESQRERDKYLDLARELKKTMEYEGDTNCKWHAWYNHQRISTGTGGLGNKRMSEDHPNYSIVEISHWRLKETYFFFFFFQNYAFSLQVGAVKS